MRFRRRCTRNLRIGGLGHIALQSLQVLSGDRYLAEANNNRVRDITVQAPRGRIVDRNGQLLVDNRQVESLDEEIELKVATEVSFIKLVPLVGG